jgi:hypothetical protein
MMTYYADILEGGRVRACLAYDQPEVGPPLPLWEGQAEGQIVLLDGPIDWGGGGSDTAVLYMVDRVQRWVEMGPLEQLKAEAVARTYADVDAVYDAAIGRRATEYASAEAAAREYLATEMKPSVVSGYITGHARSNPTGQQQTNEWAAQQIIERADAFRWAELQMRNVRFDRQTDMRGAATPDELAAAVGTWSDFITWLRATLGL